MKLSQIQEASYYKQHPAVTWCIKIMDRYIKEGDWKEVPGGTYTASSREDSPIDVPLEGDSEITKWTHQQPKVVDDQYLNEYHWYVIYQEHYFRIKMRIWHTGRNQPTPDIHISYDGDGPENIGTLYLDKYKRI